MLKKLFVTLAGLVAVIGGIAYIFLGGIVPTIKAAYANQRMPVTPVTTMVVSHESWQPTLTAVGSLSAVQGVTISAELDGTVAGIHFEAGTKVRKGDLLVQMDIGPEQAQLAAAKAALQLAEVNLKRSRELLQRNTISQAQLDNDVSAEAQAEAQVENIAATIAKKTIRAPFTGRLGVRLINLGQTLKAGDPIVSLQALDPIYADFYLPQQALGDISQNLPVKITCDVFPNASFDGKLSTISPEIDQTSRNIRLQATLRNAQEKLRPGMFVNVDVLLPKTEEVLPIPQTAVLYAPFGDSIFVVETQKDPKTGATMQVAKQRFVRLGRTRGDFVTVDSGLSPGDTVITTGVFKLQTNMPVKTDNSLAPDAQLAPQPNDT